MSLDEMEQLFRVLAEELKNGEPASVLPGDRFYLTGFGLHDEKSCEGAAVMLKFMEEQRTQASDVGHIS